MRHITYGTCIYVVADVWLPFEASSVPLASSSSGDVTLVENTQLSGYGQAVELNRGSVSIVEDDEHLCLFNPVAECADGFTLSFWLKLAAGLTGKSVCDVIQ